VPRHSRPSRHTARSHTPDVPRAIDRAAACSEVPAVLPRRWMFFNGLASARQYARARPPGNRSTMPLPHAPSAPPGRPGGACDHQSYAKGQPATRRPLGAQGSWAAVWGTRRDYGHAWLPAASGATSPAGNRRAQEQQVRSSTGIGELEEPEVEITVRQRNAIGFITIARTLLGRYPRRSANATPRLQP